jgi:hypothetical protein
MRPSFTTAALAATIAAALAITIPAFARGGPGGGAPGGGSSAIPPAPSVPPPSVPGARRAGGPQMSSAATPRGFSSPGRRTGWQGGSNLPGWSHGQKTGWNGGTKPRGLSKH